MNPIFKICSECSIQQKLYEFPFLNGKTLERSNTCFACQFNKTLVKRVVSNKKKTYHKNYQKKYKTICQIYVMNLLRKSYCIDCGISYPVPLEFDHVRGIKLGGISVIAQRNDLKLLIDEINKCEIRCANCHKQRHLYEKQKLNNPFLPPIGSLNYYLTKLDEEFPD